VWFIGERALGYPLMRGTILKEEDEHFLVDVTNEEGVLVKKQKIRYEADI
jgi:hypothetical protein